MTRKFFKKLATPLLVFLVFPMTLVCCCIGKAAAHSHEVQSSAAEHEHDHSHHHQHGQNKPCSHDHGQCDHNQLLSPFLTKQSVQLFECLAQIFQFHKNSLPLQKSVRNTSALPLTWEFDTGPPGIAFSSIPLYLEISVLRI